MSTPSDNFRQVVHVIMRYPPPVYLDRGEVMLNDGVMNLPYILIITLERSIRVKKFYFLVAVVLFVTLFTPTLVSAATCLQCGSNQTFPGLISLEGRGPTYSNCWEEKLQDTIICGNCGSERLDGAPYWDSTPHNIIYQDLGCSDGVHSWKRCCTKCGYFIIQRVSCPGPPHCVSPW